MCPGEEVGTAPQVCAADFRAQSPTGATAGAKMGRFRLRRVGGAGAHKNQPPRTIPLPFGKGEQPGLGLNGFVLAGPWVSNWVFFFFL